MGHPLVTISVPVFNTDPRYLEDAILSAKSQTYPNVQIIVVDDGSTRADTLEALNALEDVSLLHQENSGPGAAANAAVGAGDGEYVLNLSADDILTPGSVSSLLQTLTSAKDTVIAYPVVEKFGTETGLLETPDEARLEDILIYNCIVTTSLVRRTHWELGGGFDTHRDCSEDWPLWGSVLGRTGGRAVKSRDALLLYRRTGDTLNIVNRQRGRVRNARLHIAQSLPPEKRAVYSAMLSAYHDLEDDLIRVRGDAKRWRKVAPVIEPLLRVVRRLRHPAVGRFASTEGEGGYVVRDGLPSPGDVVLRREES